MTNRSRGRYDITLECDGLIWGANLAHELSSSGVARPAVVTLETQPARLDEVVRNADLPRRIENLDAGMGFSRRIEDVPNGYAYTLPGYCRAPGGIFMPAGKLTEITMPPTTGPGSWEPSNLFASVRFAGKTFLVGYGRHVLELSPDGLTATVSATFAAPFQAAGVAIFNDRLYVSGGVGGLTYRDASGTWATPATGVVRGALATVSWRPQGVPTQVLLAISQEFHDSVLRWCPITADPMVDDNWSAPVRIGSGRQVGDPAFGPIVTAPRHAYVFGREGIYDMDELGTRTLNIAPWVGEAFDSTNGAFGLHLGSALYYAHSQGLAYVATSGETQYAPEWAHPGFGLPYEGEARGFATAGTLHAGWMMVGLRYPFVNLEHGMEQPGLYTSYLMAGRRDPTAAHGQATHIWHGAEAVVPDAITHMRVYSNAEERDWPELLICTTDGVTQVPPGRTTRCYWQSLTRTGSPLQELIWGGDFVPADAASLFLPADAWGRPSAVTTLIQLEMVTERLNPGSDYLKAYASADHGPWVEQGVAEEGSYTSLAPLELTEGRYVSVRIDAVGSPILRSAELRAAIGVQLRESRQYRLILAWDNALKGGGAARETADPERRLMDLLGMLGRVVILDDGSPGGPLRVRLLQVLSGERRRIGGPTRAGSNGTEGAWAIVVPILVSILDHPMRWDGPPATDRYDRDRTWA